jgi:TPR repeat protein
MSNEQKTYLRSKAEQGDAMAQYNLGVLYARGWGVPQDFIEAHLWLSLAAAQGNKLAAQEHDKVVMKMTPEEIAEAQQLATQCQTQ